MRKLPLDVDEVHPHVSSSGSVIARLVFGDEDYMAGPFPSWDVFKKWMAGRFPEALKEGRCIVLSREDRMILDEARRIQEQMLDSIDVGTRIAFNHKGARRTGVVTDFNHGWARVEGDPTDDWKHGDPRLRPVVQFNVEHPARDVEVIG